MVIGPRAADYYLYFIIIIRKWIVVVCIIKVGIYYNNIENAFLLFLKGVAC